MPPIDPTQSAGPAPSDQWLAAAPPEPSELRAIVVLLVVNLALSLILTVVTIIARHSIVDYQLDHRHITDPATRETLRHSYVGTIISRVIGNIVVSVVYAFLVRALFRGRRWAYRRVIWLAAAGIVGLLVIQISPYPPWMRVEQLVQAAVLGGLLYFVTRPPVRAYFAKGLPGRDVRRFRRA
jgi:MFS family permease